jgi:hypothetical protein
MCWLDVLSAVGPTLAAGIAVGVSIWATLVAKRSVEALQANTDLQRAISRPLLTIYPVTERHDSGTALTLELQNTGQTVAHIRQFRVLVDGKEQLPQIESGNAFWLTVLTELGFKQTGAINGAMFTPPVLVAGGDSLPLLSVVLNNTDVLAARIGLRRLKFEAEYTSSWGEVYRIPADG